MTPEESAEILKLATAVGGIGARMDAIEHARQLAREEDHEWRAGIAEDISEIKGCITEMPCLMDAKIAACREGREAVTKDAVAYATKRHALSSVAVDWRTWTAFLIALASFIYATWPRG